MTLPDPLDLARDLVVSDAFFHAVGLVVLGFLCLAAYTALTAVVASAAIRWVKARPPAWSPFDDASLVADPLVLGGARHARCPAGVPTRRHPPGAQRRVS
jgi:hypothetical protein